MFDLLQKYWGKLVVNGVEYPNVSEASKEFKGKDCGLTIILNGDKNNENNTPKRNSDGINIEFDPDMVYQITVQAYMTTYKDDFFLATSPQLANKSPMPYRTMVGKVIQELNGLVKMELRCDIPFTRYTNCIKCGRPIPDKVHQYFGLGAECASFDISEDDLKNHEKMAKFRNYLYNIQWTGWIVKSAITSKIEIPDYQWYRG